MCIAGSYVAVLEVAAMDMAHHGCCWTICTTSATSRGSTSETSGMPRWRHLGSPDGDIWGSILGSLLGSIFGVGIWS